MRRIVALAEGIRKLAREGSLLMVVSDAFLTRAAEKACEFANIRPRTVVAFGVP